MRMSHESWLRSNYFLQQPIDQHTCRNLPHISEILPYKFQLKKIKRFSKRKGALNKHKQNNEFLLNFVPMFPLSCVFQYSVASETQYLHAWK